MGKNQNGLKNTYMTVPEFADYVHINKKTAYRMITDGRIPAYRLSPRKILIAKDDVDHYLSRRLI